MTTDSENFDGSTNGKKKSITFRVDKEALNKIKLESSSKDINLNALINQVLKRYVEWDVFESKVGLISIPKEIVKTIFSKLEESEIMQMAELVGKDEFKNMTMMMEKKFDLLSFLTLFEKNLDHSRIGFTKTVQDNECKYIINHDMGFKWSLYHKTIIELLNNEFFKNKIKVEYDNRLLIIDTEINQ